MLLVQRLLLGTEVVPLVRRVVTETPRKASAVCQPEKHCAFDRRNAHRRLLSKLEWSVDTYRTGSIDERGHTIFAAIPLMAQRIVHSSQPWSYAQSKISWLRFRENSKHSTRQQSMYASIDL
jgi:hypothetical protein